jgi:hypothetical protein
MAHQTMDLHDAHAKALAAIQEDHGSDEDEFDYQAALLVASQASALLNKPAGDTDTSHLSHATAQVPEVSR